jgi:hypothetical protein
LETNPLLYWYWSSCGIFTISSHIVYLWWIDL